MLVAINESEKRIQPLQLILLCLAVITFSNTIRLSAGQRSQLSSNQPENKHFPCAAKNFVYAGTVFCVSK